MTDGQGPMTDQLDSLGHRSSAILLTLSVIGHRSSAQQSSCSTSPTAWPAGRPGLDWIFRSGHRARFPPGATAPDPDPTGHTTPFPRNASAMDILGIGTDIIECPRIGKMIEQHGELFLRRV